jgi:hypothetical protein
LFKAFNLCLKFKAGDLKRLLFKASALVSPNEADAGDAPARDRMSVAKDKKRL